MRILLSNDDGIFAEGIKALVDILSPLGEIYVVAPDRERSATGHGITMDRPLRPKEIELENARGAWAVDGTPADCVKLGIEALLPYSPDILVAGINRGPNLGTDVLYSGTVSAAVEGLINDIPSAAISLAAHEDLDFYSAADFIRDIIPELAKHILPSDCLCNINIPAGVPPKGNRVTCLCRRRYNNVFYKRFDPRGKPYYWMGGQPEDEELPGGRFMTDSYAVNKGYISITPVHFDLTDYNTIEMLNQWFAGLVAE